METQLILSTDINATSALIKERLGKYDFLRITEDLRGLHIYNIPKQADLLLFRKPNYILGTKTYGRILYAKDGDMQHNGPIALNRHTRYLDKDQFEYALQKLFAIAEEIYGNNQ